MDEYNDDLAGMRAGADQLMMLWKDVMPIVRAVHDAALMVGFTEDQASAFSLSYFNKIAGPNDAR